MKNLRHLLILTSIAFSCHGKSKLNFRGSPLNNGVGDLSGSQSGESSDNDRITIPDRCRQIQIENDAEQIISKKCLTCHNNANHEGNIDLSLAMNSYGEEREVWDKAFAALVNGSMPPSGELISECEIYFIGSFLQGKGIPVSMPAPATLVRISPTEYDNSITLLLGETFQEGRARIPSQEDEFSVFKNETNNLAMNRSSLTIYKDLASQIASRFLANQRSQNFASPECKSDFSGIECAQTAIDNVMDLLFTSKLSESMKEKSSAFISELLTIDQSITADDLVNFTIQWLLVHPNFIFRAPDETSPNSDNILRRLAYFAWALPPDASIKQHADKGDWDKVKEVLLSDSRFQSNMRNVLYEWLDIDKFELSSDRIHQMLFRESKETIENILKDKDLNWRNLLLHDKGYLDQELADHYGLQANSNGWQSLGSARGLLHHGSVLARHSDGDDIVNITSRGKFLSDRVLCKSVPLPTIDVNDIKAEDFTDSDCAIDLMSAVAEDQNCGGCHNKTDPLGFVAFRYSNYGIYRESEPNKSQCTTVKGGSLPEIGAFQDLTEMIEKAFETDIIDRCFSRHVLAYAYNRQPKDMSHIEVDQVLNGLKEGKLKFSALASEIMDLIINRELEN